MHGHAGSRCAGVGEDTRVCIIKKVNRGVRRAWEDEKSDTGNNSGREAIERVGPVLKDDLRMNDFLCSFHLSRVVLVRLQVFTLQNKTISEYNNKKISC